MAKEIKLGIKIAGDASGGVKAVRLTRDELRKLSDSARQSNKAITGIGRRIDSLSGIAKAASGVLAGLFSVRGIKSAIDAYAEQEQAVRQLEATLLSTGGAAGKTSAELQKTAASLQSMTTFGDEAIIQMQALLLTFTNIKGDNFDLATRAVLNLSTAMGIDLKSASVQVGKALNDPIAGLNALTRSGIQFSDVQKETILTLVETGQTAEAQRIILKELEVQFGGSAEAAAKGSGQLSQFANSLGDVAEKIGGAILNSRTFQNVLANLKDTADLLAGNISLKRWASQTNSSMRFVAKTVKAVTSGFSVLGDTLSAIGSAAVALFDGEFSKLPEIFAALDDDVTKTADSMNKFFAEVDDGTKSSEKAGSAMDGTNKILQKQDSALKNTASSAADYTQSMDRSSAGTTRFQRSVQSLIDRLFPAQKAARELANEQQLLRKAVDDGLITWDEYDAALERLVRTNKTQTGELLAQKEAVGGLSDEYKKLGTAIGQAANAANSAGSTQNTRAGSPPPGNTRAAGGILQFSKLFGGVNAPPPNEFDKFADGGSFMVGGSGGVDSQLVAFRASPNERVTIETPQQQKNQSQNVTFNISMTGVQNVKQFVDELEQFSRTNPIKISVGDIMTEGG